MINEAVKRNVSANVCNPIGKPMRKSSFSSAMRSIVRRIEVMYLRHSFLSMMAVKKQIGIAVRAMSVERPAPVAPIAGQPQCPKIKIQLRPILSRLHANVIIIATVVLPNPSRNCLDRLKKLNGMIDSTMSVK